MEVDVSIGGKSLSFNIDNPFHLDVEGIVGSIDHFARENGVTIDGLDIRGLLPLMVKGIAGCEDGCPANAKGLVSQGFKNFDVEYIEGGILSAKASVDGNRAIELKMFPEF